MQCRVHGQITLHGLLVAVMDTAEFQRLDIFEIAPAAQMLHYTFALFLQAACSPSQLQGANARHRHALQSTPALHSVARQG